MNEAPVLPHVVALGALRVKLARRDRSEEVGFITKEAFETNMDKNIKSLANPIESTTEVWVGKSRKSEKRVGSEGSCLPRIEVGGHSQKTLMMPEFVKPS